MSAPGEAGYVTLQSSRGCPVQAPLGRRLLSATTLGHLTHRTQPLCHLERSDTIRIADRAAKSRELVFAFLCTLGGQPSLGRF